MQPAPAHPVPALFEIRIALILSAVGNKNMTNQTTESSFTVNPEAAASIHDHGIVILHTGIGRVFRSNLTGARIWSGIERRLSLDAIAEEISGAFQIARSTAREHALQFLAELERHTLIHRAAHAIAPIAVQGAAA